MSTSASLPVDDKRHGPYETVKSLGFSADSRQVFYAARLKGRWHFVFDGKPGPGDAAMLAPALSPSGRRQPYGHKRSARNSEWHINLDGPWLSRRAAPLFQPFGLRLSGLAFVRLSVSSGPP